MIFLYDNFVRRIFIILGFLIFILFFSLQFLNIAVAQTPIPAPPPPTRIDTPPPPSPTRTEVAPGPTEPEPPPLPCASFDANRKCTSVNTALGNIKTSPGGFIKDIFSLILGVSGGIALLLIIYSGYKLMAARGEPEALQAARDQLIAAIIGLVFIIFSLVILEIIGVDILRIPGFER